MYPQATQEVNYLGPAGYQNAALSQQPNGIASRVAELQKAVQEIVSLAYQTKAALGITSPETEGKSPQQPSSLAEVITDLRIRLTRGCADLNDAIQHLSS